MVLIPYILRAMLTHSPFHLRQAVYMLDVFHWARYIIMSLFAAKLAKLSTALTVGTPLGFAVAVWAESGFDKRSIPAVLQYGLACYVLYVWNEWNGRGLLAAGADKNGATPLLYAPRMFLAKCGFTSLPHIIAMGKERHVVEKGQNGTLRMGNGYEGAHGRRTSYLCTRR